MQLRWEGVTATEVNFAKWERNGCHILKPVQCPLRDKVHSTIHHWCHFRIHYYDFALVFVALLFKLCPFFCQQVFPQTLLCPRHFLDLGDASTFKLSKIFSPCFLLSFQPSEASRPLFLIPSRKWERICGFPLRSPMKLWARLKLEIRSFCSQLTNHTFHYTRQDPWAGSSSGQSTLWIGAYCICPWIVTFWRTTEQLVFEKWPAVFKQHQGKSVMRSKVLSLKFSFCVFEKEKKRPCVYMTWGDIKWKQFSQTLMSVETLLIRVAPRPLLLLLFFIFIFLEGRDDPAEFWSMPIAAFSKSQSQQ